MVSMGDEMSDFGFYFYEDLDDQHASVTSTTSLSSAVSAQDLMVDDPQPETLTSYPPILSSTMIDTLIEDGLPWSMQDVKWTRIFASSRDGNSFGHFMRSARNVPNTIIVASTSTGKIVGGYTKDVWSGGRKKMEKESKQDFLFVFDSSATSTTMTGNGNVLHEHQIPVKRKRFIPGLEDFSSSPRGVLDFDFESLTLSSDKIDTKKRQVMHIYKPLGRQKPLKQTCQLGNRLLSLGSYDDDKECNKDKNCYLTIEKSSSKGRANFITSEDEERISEEFEVVNFEVYCLSDE